MELAMGVLALVPRNMGATLFLPSLVMVTFCCTMGGAVANQSEGISWEENLQV